MEYVDILREAHKIIQNKSERFICNAIFAVVNPTKEQKLYLCGWIQKMLGDHIHYESWLKTNHPDIYNTALICGNSEFREARIQWLNWMIADCEKEEAK